jgi:acyl-coenzyme A thioesterase PaaI-like protein
MSISPTPPQPPASASPGRVVPFHSHARIEILDAPAGEGRARIPDAPELTNHFGTVHGGMLYSVGEVAAASGMMRVLGPQAASLRAITRRGAIEYLKPSRGVISGAAKVGMSAADISASLARFPSVNVPIAVELSDETGVVVARLNVEWFVGNPKAS